MNTIEETFGIGNLDKMFTKAWEEAKQRVYACHGPTVYSCYGQTSLEEAFQEFSKQYTIKK